MLYLSLFLLINLQLQQEITFNEKGLNILSIGEIFDINNSKIPILSIDRSTLDGKKEHFIATSGIFNENYIVNKMDISNIKKSFLNIKSIHYVQSLDDKKIHQICISLNEHEEFFLVSFLDSKYKKIEISGKTEIENKHMLSSFMWESEEIIIYYSTSGYIWLYKK